MPTMILKPTPESEKYVLWSTVVDSPVGYDSRENLQNGPYRQDFPDERFDRVDRTGTSLFDGAYGWESKYRSLTVRELGHNRGFYRLHLDNLEPFIAALWEIDGRDRDAQQQVLDKFCTMIVDGE